MRSGWEVYTWFVDPGQGLHGREKLCKQDPDRNEGLLGIERSLKLDSVAKEKPITRKVIGFYRCGLRH
jgi:hypothetical protein